MSKLKKFFAVTASLILVIVLLLQIDNKLSPEATSMLDSIEWQKSNDAYIYLLGIGAALGEDPKVEGTLVLAQIRKAEESYAQASSDDWGSYDRRPTINLPEHDSFCSVNETDCITSLFIQSDIDLNDPLMIEVKHRHETFLKLDGFTTMTQPHLYEPFANFVPLVKGNRLVSLNAIESAKKCCPEDAMKQLYAHIELLKKYTKETDNLIGQMIAYVLLNETIDVLSLLVEKYDLAGRPIALLTSDELSLDRVMDRELAFGSSILQPNVFEDSYKPLPKWVIKTVFKPNMTINTSATGHLSVKEISMLPQVNFIDAIENQDNNKFDVSDVRNILGFFLYKIGMNNNFSSYIARGFDLNSKITLFNGLLAKPLNDDVLSGIANPYYQEEYDAYYDAETSRVCLGGPYEMMGFARCLITSKERQ